MERPGRCHPTGLVRHRKNLRPNEYTPVKSRASYTIVKHRRITNNDHVDSVDRAVGRHVLATVCLPLDSLAGSIRTVMKHEPG